MHTVTSIVVRHQIIGFHRWPDAPNEVAYLRDSHRHVFKIAVWFRVDHNDRALEFHTLQKVVAKHVEYMAPKINGFDFGSRSCEMIAESLLAALRIDYPVYKVVVSEDGEHDGVVELHPQVLYP